MGVGMGFIMTPMSTAAMNAVDRTKAGVASGILSMSRMVGGTLGVAVLGALVGNPRDPQAFVASLGNGLLIGSAIAAVGALVAWKLISPELADSARSRRRPPARRWRRPRRARARPFARRRSGSGGLRRRRRAGGAAAAAARPRRHRRAPLKRLRPMRVPTGFVKRGRGDLGRALAATLVLLAGGGEAALQAAFPPDAGGAAAARRPPRPSRPPRCRRRLTAARRTGFELRPRPARPTTA